MNFNTKIAVVLRNNLPNWQKLNVTAFTVSGIAGTVEGIMGENYEDGSGNSYLPMIVQPIMIYSANEEQIRKVYEKALKRNVSFSIFTEDLFSTTHDAENRAAVKSYTMENLKIVGMAMRDEKKTIDKVIKGLTLHD